MSRKPRLKATFKQIHVSEFGSSRGRYAAKPLPTIKLVIMKQVHLELPTEEQKFDAIDLVAEFTERDLALFHQYRTLTSRVRTSTLLQRGMKGFQGLTFDQSGLSIRAGTCSLPELYELLHVLRPVTLENERASFSKVVKIFEDRLAHEFVLNFLRLNQHAFRHGEMSLFFQVSLGDKPLFSESLLRTWLNGTQYHTDATKAADWAALEATLGETNAQAAVMSQLHGKVVSVLNIDYLAKLILDAPQYDA